LISSPFLIAQMSQDSVERKRGGGEKGTEGIFFNHMTESDLAC